MPRNDEWDVPEGIAKRVSVSVTTGIAWLIFLIIFLGFFADRFTIYQNLAIILASILVVALVLGPMWTHWSIKYWDACKKKNTPAKRRKRKK